MNDDPLAPSGSPEHVIVGFAPSVAGDIASSAARVGQYLWVSARMFEVTGRWATAADRPDHKIRLAAASSRFAWQASQWRDRLPRLREVDVAALIRPADAAMAGRFERLDTVPEPSREGLLRSVITELEVTYATHAVTASPLRDGPILRSLERIRCDLAGMNAQMRDI